MRKQIILTVTCLALIALGFTAFAATPGSSDDPIVTKSYVDEQIAALERKIGSGGTSSLPSGDEAALRAILTSYIDSLFAGRSGGDAAFTPVFAQAGEVIIGGEGTEIILRSGSAAAFTATPDGIVNLSSGKELFSGAAVDKNNLLIVPRNDGRGVSAVSDAWFIIKGGYSFLNR